MLSRPVCEFPSHNDFDSSKGPTMSRKILALPLLAALALVGCDDSSSSSSSSSSGTPSAGTCVGYKGHWVAESTVVEDGVSSSMKFDLTLSATSVSAKIDATMGTTVIPVGTMTGSLKDIGSSKIVVTATNVKELDFETGSLVTSENPSDYEPDTLVYSFPSAGKMRILEVNEPETESITYTCK